MTLVPHTCIIIIMDDFYSVNEAAEKLNLDSSHVRRLLAKGVIKGKKLGRDWVVLDLNYQRKRRPKGGKKNEEP